MDFDDLDENEGSSGLSPMEIAKKNREEQLEREAAERAAEAALAEERAKEYEEERRRKAEESKKMADEARAMMEAEKAAGKGFSYEKSAVGGGAASGSWFRCVMKPKMIIRKSKDANAEPARMLAFGETIECKGAAKDNWVTLLDGTYAMVNHPKLGKLLEPVAAPAKAEAAGSRPGQDIKPPARDAPKVDSTSKVGSVSSGGDRERFMDFDCADWEPLPEDRWKKWPIWGMERPTKMKDFKEAVVRDDPGEFWGIKFPRTPGELKEMGPAWLTKAMHTVGSLPKDNEVVKFTKFEIKAGDVTKEGTADDTMWGGAGCKVLLSVEYKNGPGDLTEGMFIKMPHEFTGKNERYKNSITLMSMDWNEVMFMNTLAGKIKQPRTPRCYFADMNRKTTHSIIIMEVIPYGNKKIPDAGEFCPPTGKYRDWDVPNVVDLYYAHTKALAQFCGTYTASKGKSEQIDLCFMDEGSLRFRQSVFGYAANMSMEQRDKEFLKLMQDPNLAGFAQSQGFPPNVATAFLQLAEDFVSKVAPQYFPKDLTEPKMKEKIFKEGHEMAHYLSEMGFYSALQPEYFALAHPNAQIDNAFFWRREDRSMACGLTDFGSMSHMQMPGMLQGGWCGAEPEVMDDHEENLVKVFIAEYERCCGVKLDYDYFYLHLKLGQASTFCGCAANLGGCYRIMPKEEWKSIKSRFDAKIDNTFLVRCYTVQIIFCLAWWRKRSPYPYFQKWMKLVGMPAKV